MTMLTCWFLFVVVIVMEVSIASAQLSPSVQNTCLDSETGYYFCCSGFDQVGDMCVVWRCSNELPCSRGTCNMVTRQCNCPPGWEGSKCELPCKSGRFGQNCLYECNCINGAGCEPVNGECACLAGFMGETCEQPCPSGTFGRHCRGECDCLNGSPCNTVDGMCICEAGLTGDRCETCLPEKHLMQCFTFCQAVCMNGGVCDTIKGRCECSTGYTGDHCEICNPAAHLDNCIPDCDNTLCANGAICDTNERKCQCTEGWTGRSCNAPCPDGYYGQDCTEDCNCIGSPCHHITGKCLNECPVGWSGNDCRQPCVAGTYGYRCMQTCKCQNEAKCEATTGNCLCNDGYHGKYCEDLCPPTRSGINCKTCLCQSPHTCHDEFEMCVCPAGFMGLSCEEPCPEGYYGPSCLKNCNCLGNESCNAVSGMCKCDPGWIGATCQSMCPHGTFGLECRQTCPKCPNLNECFHVNGSCDMCNSGFKGKRCNVPCSRGFYGPSCMYQCSCNDGMCNPTNGACPLPYSQSPSTVGMNFILDEQDNDFPMFIIISASTLSILLILMLTILLGTRIYQKGYKHGSRSSQNAMTDVVSMNSSNGNGRPYIPRATVQTFTTSGDSGMSEFSTHLHIEGDTPDIIASNSTSCSADPDESSYTEVEINLCHPTSTNNEYLYTSPPALPAQNTCQTISLDENKNRDFYDEAYSSIDKKDFNLMEDSEDNCYDFLSDSQTLPEEINKVEPGAQHQYYVLEPNLPQNDDDYDSISEEETEVCLPEPNNYEDITINRAGPSQPSETYEEVTNPLMHHHTLDSDIKNKKKNVYDLLGHSAKRRKRIGSEELNGNNSNYGRLQKESKSQSGYNELEYGPKTVRVGKTVFPTGNFYGSLNR